LAICLRQGQWPQQPGCAVQSGVDRFGFTQMIGTCTAGLELVSPVNTG